MNDEDVKILEELKASLSKNLERLNDNDISTTMYHIFSLRKRQFQAIENLLNRNKELEEENTVLKKANNISENVTIKDITNFMNKSLEDFNKEYIPVAKIKERFEKNKARTDCRYCNNTCDSYAVCMFCKDLLEGK